MEISFSALELWPQDAQQQTHSAVTVQQVGEFTHPLARFACLSWRPLDATGTLLNRSTTQWPTHQITLEVAYSRSWGMFLCILISMSLFSPEVQGHRLHLSVQEDQADPKERKHKPNMDSFHSVCDTWSLVKSKQQMAMFTMFNRTCPLKKKYFYTFLLLEIHTLHVNSSACNSTHRFFSYSINAVHLLHVNVFLAFQILAPA